MELREKDLATIEFARGAADSASIEGARYATVASPEQEKEAAAFVARLSSLMSDLKARRDAVVRPIKEGVRAFEAQYAEVIAPLDAAKREVTAAMSEYRQQEVMREAVAIRKETEKIGRTAMYQNDQKTLAEVAPVHAEAAAIAPASVRTEHGGVSYATRQHVEVVDPSAVPREYCVPDMGLIKAAIKLGKTVAGVSVTDKQSVVVRRR